MMSDTIRQSARQSTKLPLPATLAIDPFGPDIRVGMEAAFSVGVSGISVGADHPALAGPDMGQTARRHFLHTLAGRGLSLTCLRTGSGAGGIFDPRTVDRLVERGIAAISMARNFHCPLAGIYLGEPLPKDFATANSTEDQSSPAYTPGRAEAFSAVATLADFADRAGVTLALTSGDSAAVLAFVAHVNARCVCGGLDSLRLLGAGENVAEAAARLADHLALWICTDAQRVGRRVLTRPLGTGQTQPERILRVLDDADFKGVILLDLRHAPDPLQTAHQEALTLRTLLAKNVGSAGPKG